MSGIKYEVLTGDDLISALRGGRTGDLLDDAAYAAADEIERLRRELAEARAALQPCECCGAPIVKVEGGAGDLPGWVQLPCGNYLVNSC